MLILNHQKPVKRKEKINTDNGLFITGSDIIIDGDATASYFYGKLQSD